MPCQAPCADGCAAQVLGVVGLVGVQRTVQNNGNMKSEPKYLACARISNTCFLLFNSFSFFCRSLGFYSGQTSLFFLFSKLPAVGWVQHLLMHMALQNTHVAKGQLRSELIITHLT